MIRKRARHKRKSRAIVLVSAPAFFTRPDIRQPSLRRGNQFHSRGKGGGRSAAWRNGPSVVASLRGRRALRRSSSAISRHGPRFSWGLHLSVSELLAPVRSDRRRSPMPSRERGSGPRPQAPDLSPHKW